MASRRTYRSQGYWPLQAAVAMQTVCRVFEACVDICAVVLSTGDQSMLPMPMAQGAEALRAAFEPWLSERYNLWRESLLVLHVTRCFPSLVKPGAATYVPGPTVLWLCPQCTQTVLPFAVMVTSEHGWCVMTAACGIAYALAVWVVTTSAVNAQPAWQPQQGPCCPGSYFV